MCDNEKSIEVVGRILEERNGLAVTSEVLSISGQVLWDRTNDTSIVIILRVKYMFRLRLDSSDGPTYFNSSIHSLNYVIINTVQYITIAHSLRLFSNRGGPQV